MRASNVIAAIASADLKTLDRGPKMSSLFGRVDYHDSTKGGFAKSGFAKHMNLDWQICSRARLSRDARFDGKFFIGVIAVLGEQGVGEGQQRVDRVAAGGDCGCGSRSPGRARS